MAASSDSDGGHQLEETDIAARYALSEEMAEDEDAVSEHLEESSLRRKLERGFLETSIFEYAMHILIFVNVIIMVAEVDDGAMLLPSPAWRQLLSQLLVVAFAAEIALRLFVYRDLFFHNGLNVMDLTVVSVDAASLLLDFFIPGLPSTSVVRVVRLAKLLRAPRLLKNCREIEVMFGGIAGACRAIFFGAILIGLLLLVWSLIAVELLHPVARVLHEEGAFADCERCPRAFSSVSNSAVTFVQQVIAGDGWGDICLPLIERQPLLIFFFVLVIVTVDMGLLNLMLSAIVDGVHERREQDELNRIKEKNENYRQARKQLNNVCRDMDTDGDGLLSMDEVQHGYSDNTEFFRTLHLLDVELADLALVFRALDSNSNGTISHEEFVDQLHKLKTQDDHSLLIFIKCHIQTLAERHRDSFGELLGQFQSCLTLQQEELRRLILQSDAQGIAESHKHVPHPKDWSRASRESDSTASSQLVVTEEHNFRIWHNGNLGWLPSPQSPIKIAQVETRHDAFVAMKGCALRFSENCHGNLKSDAELMLDIPEVEDVSHNFSLMNL